MTINETLRLDTPAKLLRFALSGTEAARFHTAKSMAAPPSRPCAGQSGAECGGGDLPERGVGIGPNEEAAWASLTAVNNPVDNIRA